MARLRRVDREAAEDLFNACCPRLALTDVDTFESAARVVADAPGTRFAAEFRRKSRTQRAPPANNR